MIALAEGVITGAGGVRHHPGRRAAPVHLVAPDDRPDWPLLQLPARPGARPEVRAGRLDRRGQRLAGGPPRPAGPAPRRRGLVPPRDAGGNHHQRGGGAPVPARGFRGGAGHRSDLGGALNLAFIKRVEATSRRVFQERWLRERGKVDVIEPLETHPRWLAQGWSGALVRVAHAGGYGVGYATALPFWLAVAGAPAGWRAAAGRGVTLAAGRPLS